jgi:branched-chain amino acid transport system permease protein
MDLFSPHLLAESGINFSTLPSQLVNGLLLGSIYALIALGYTMVYGVLRLINFAHGEVFMLGAYTSLFVAWKQGFGQGVSPDQMPQGSWGLLIGMMIISMLVCAIIGVIIEFVAYRPMRNQSRIAALITAIGISLLLQYGGQLFLPAEPPPSISEKVLPDSIQGSYTMNLKKAPPQLVADLDAAKTKLQEIKDRLVERTTAMGISEFGLPDDDPDRVAKLETQDLVNRLNPQVEEQSIAIIVPKGQLVMFGTVVMLMGILWWLVMFTKTGRAMRAAAHDFESASLMGINVNRVVVITFIIGSALAGAGAMMNAVFIRTPLTPFYGFMPGVKAFVAAVLGGIGNIPGAVLGGLVMGIAESLIVWVGYSEYKDAIAFVILIVVLMFRPGGLLGSSKVEKV